MLHGGDYNPEQWIHRPEVLEADPILMRQAGVNQASVGIFAWAALEPERDRFTWDWLDRVMDRLHAAGVGVLLATPSAARPRWLAEAHPEVMRTRRDGRPIPPGEMRHNHCLSSPVLRERVALVDTKLAERYAGHPALLGWHISNEFGGDEDGARCYCARCLAGFRDWLRVRYHDDLEALNRAWWTGFWSHQYGSWDQIRPGDASIEALNLNWQRYTSGLVADFCAAEIAAVRRHSALPATTNFHGNLAHYDHGEVAAHLDLMSYDSYPFIDGGPGDLGQVHWHAWAVDAVRGHAPGRPWLLMESCPSLPQWHRTQRLKRPGVHRALSLAMVGHGSDGVCYFQWRAGRGGMEKLHGAVLMQDAPHDTRVFREVATLGGELARLGAVAGSAVPAEAAVLWDVQSEWARGWNSGLHSLPFPAELSQGWHRPLWQAGIGVDVVDGTRSLAGYRLVIVPGLFLLRPGLAERLQQAAAAGAQILIDGLSAWVDDDMACVAGGRPGPLAVPLGLRCEEFDQLRSDESVAMVDAGGWLSAAPRVRGWIDRVHPDGCEVLVHATGGFHDGWPVLTRKACGAGAMWYLAAGLAAEDAAALTVRLAAIAQVQPALTGLPRGIIARERRQPDRRFVFLINPGDEPATVELPGGGWSDAVGDSEVGPRLVLGAWDARVVSQRCPLP